MLALLTMSWWAAATPSMAANRTAATLGGNATFLPGGDFENPSVSSFQYGPSSSTWSYTGSSGLSKNNSGFTAGNPGAPQGAQVLFLQGTGYVSQNVDFVAGYYTFRLKAAQRGNHQASSQTIELRIDGASVLSISPSGTSYQDFVTAPIALTSGSHSIQLVGINPNGGDNTAFVDDFTSTREISILTSDFESPLLSAGTFQYGASGGGWTLTNGAGLSRNSSGFTAGNPGAPRGQQVMFIQGYGQAVLPMTIPADGFYRFTFKGAHRGNNLGDGEVKHIRFFMDNTEFSEHLLESATYQDYTTAAIYLTAGSHTLKLQGFNPLAGDHTGLVDELRLQWIHDWQDSYVWSSSVPNGNDNVTIPMGSAVGIRGTVNAKDINAMGHLVTAQNRDVNVSTDYIMVMGGASLLQLGVQHSPYYSTATFTLTANASTPEVMGMGNNFIGAMNSGTIEMHGLEKKSWSKLAANIVPNTNTLTLMENVNWEQNDEIVVVSSRGDWNEAEKRTIQSVSGNQITVTSNFLKPHVGKIKNYSNGSQSWSADLRAEVGVLTHNIKVQGNAAAAASGFGGHIMLMTGSKGYVEGIELYNMGQKAILGRYPWHWHMLGDDGEGQYFKNNSVHKSFNRAITIHGTNSTLTEGNFCYDHIGHGLFLEDGSERFNVITKNVVLLTKRPLASEALTPSDHEFNEEQNRTPSSYWITNPQNTFEDNVAAGTEGTGYWFAFPKKPMGASATDPRFSSLEPYKLPMISFQRNVAHSCMNGFDIFDQLNPDHSIKKNAGWAEYSDHVMGNCLFYANRIAIYSGIGGGGPSDNLFFRNNMFVENFIGSMLASYSIVDSSVIVANSGENLRAENVRYAYRIYDGAATLKDCHFVGWDASNTRFFLNTGAGTKHPNHIITGATTDLTGLPNSVLPNFDIPPTYSGANDPGHPRFWSIVVRDINGAISGKANTTLVGNQPFQLVGDEYQAPNWTRMYRSDHQFALGLLTYNTASANNPNVTVTRTKAGTPTASVYYIDGFKEHQQLPLIVNEDFTYTYEYESLPSTRNVRIYWMDAQIGDETILRFKDFGKLGGVSLSNGQPGFSPYGSLAALKSGSTPGYWLQNQGDLYVKVKATTAIGQQLTTVSWSNNGTYGSPQLDTDGDQMADADEITAGRHAFDAFDLAAEFNNNGDLEGWDAFNNVASPLANGSALTGTSNGIGDPYIVNGDYNFDADRVPHLFVRMKASSNSGTEIFFTTSASPGFSGSKRVSSSYTGNGNWQVVQFNMQGHSSWNSVVTALRIDPVSGIGVNFEIDWIRADCEGIDSDGDGVCDFADICSTIDDNLVGQPCNDGNPATVNDVYTTACVCAGVPAKMGAAAGTELAAGPQVELFPNPISDRLTVRWEASAGFTEVRMLDVQGRMIRQVRPEAGTTVVEWSFDKSELNAGLYVVQFIGENGALVRKVVKL